MFIGAMAKKAREEKGWNLPEIQAVLKEAGVDVSLGQIKRMEDGSRPGEPAVWGAMWTIYHLPLRDLYQGLGLPAPDELPTGEAAEIAALVDGMTTGGRRLTLSFARMADAMFYSSQRHSPLANRQDDAAGFPKRSTRPVLGGVAGENADDPARTPGGRSDE